MNRITPIKFMTAVFGSALLFGCTFFEQVLPGLTLSDADILGVLDSLDQTEIDAAQLARARASTPEVQAFAGRVLNEHRELALANGRLAAELSLQPEPSALATDLNQDHERAMQKLQAMSGPAFDRAYVRYEIEQHVRAFNFLEAAAESKTDSTLKQELVRTGPDLLSHISAARALERHLGSDQHAIASR
jgi:putative membrane protein